MTQKIALIKNGVVDNIIVADDNFLQLIQDQHDEFVKIADDVRCGPEWSWDGVTFTEPTTMLGPDGVRIPKPPLPEPTPLPTLDRLISVGAFFDRFGAQKWPILSSPDPVVQALVMDCTVRTKTGINLDRPDVQGGLQLLQAKGFAVTKEAVIDAPIKDSELP